MMTVDVAGLAAWEPPSDRGDPVDLLVEQNTFRERTSCRCDTAG